MSLGGERGNLLAPLGLFRLPFGTLAIQLRNLRAIGGEQLQAGDDAVFGRFAGDPAFGDGVFDQVQREAAVEHVDPAFLRHQTFDLAGEDLHAAAVADEDHDLVLLLLRCFQQLRQRAVVHLIGQIVADGAERLLARQFVAAEQLEELVNVGHRTPFTVDFGMILRRFIRSARLGGLQRQHRVFFAQVAFHQCHPGRQIGLFGGVNLVQRIALLVEELDAVAHAALVGFAHGENAGPVVEEQAQIQLARVEDQPGVAVEVLIAVAAHLLMHRIAVAGDGLGDADLLKLGQQGARVGLQAASVVADAGVR